MQVAGGGTWVQVSAGYLHTCAVRSTGAMYCWGDDSIGQLGDGSTGSGVGVPQLVAGSITDWRSVSAGEAFSCAVRSTGRLYCWGGDINGELGKGSARRDRATPGQVSGKRTDWKQVSAGQNHACGLRTTGRLYCWGANGGRLGNGELDPTGVPVQVAGGLTDWASVDTGSGHTCALRTSRRLFCWGSDAVGQLGDGASGDPRLTPGQVIGGARDWSRVTLGGLHTCAVKTSGRAYCWGVDLYGKLGDGDPLAGSAQPRQLVGGATDWRIIDSSGNSRHTCATTSARRLYCWGANARGQLGNGTLTPSSEPVEARS